MLRVNFLWTPGDAEIRRRFVVGSGWSSYMSNDGCLFSVSISKVFVLKRGADGLWVCSNSDDEFVFFFTLGTTFHVMAPDSQISPTVFAS